MVTVRIMMMIKMSQFVKERGQNAYHLHHHHHHHHRHHVHLHDIQADRDGNGRVDQAEFTKLWMALKQEGPVSEPFSEEEK